MALKVRSVDPQGLAARYGITAGDEILRINGCRIRDSFDLAYYSSEYQLNILLKSKDGKQKKVKISRDSMLFMGIEPAPEPIRRCQNKCVFCFVDQMPKGLRKSLYIKDDDFLMSWEHGNYISLTNLSEADFQRIMDQYISPLYISVHTTDKALRQKMMGYKKDFDILKVLRRLSRAGISFHTQIVCVPGINDKLELERTILDLTRPELNTLSIGVVPVGLTRFRTGLPDLKPFDAHSATLLLSLIDILRREIGSDIIYAADEFFVLADKAIPGRAYYQDYPQAENGIGLLSLLRAGFGRCKREVIRSLDQDGADYLLLHSQAAAGEMRKIAAQIGAALTKSTLSAKAVRNDFFGPQVTVSGLLTASDILGQHASQPRQTLILPGNMFNVDGYTLDGLDRAALAQKLGRKLLLTHPFFEEVS